MRARCLTAPPANDASLAELWVNVKNEDTKRTVEEANEVVSETNEGVEEKNEGVEEANEEQKTPLGAGLVWFVSRYAA